MKKFEKIALKVCDCGALKPHVYFYADPEEEQSILPIPFGSVEGVEIFIDAHVAVGAISPEQKEVMMKVAKEAGLREKMSEEETLVIVPLLEAIAIVNELEKN